MCHNLPRIGYKMPYNNVYTKENTMLEEFVNYVDNANLDEDENEWLNLLKDKIDSIMQSQAKYDMETV